MKQEYTVRTVCNCSLCGREMKEGEECIHPEVVKIVGEGQYECLYPKTLAVKFDDGSILSYGLLSFKNVR